jgi:hypothetical protein
MTHCIEWADYVEVMDDIHRYFNGSWYLGSFIKLKYGHTGYVNDPISW